MKLYSGQTEASRDIWYELYYDANPFEGDDHWHGRDLGDLKFRGSMNSSDEATLEIHISRK